MKPKLPTKCHPPGILVSLLLDLNVIACIILFLYLEILTCLIVLSPVSSYIFGSVSRRAGARGTLLKLFIISRKLY